MTSITLYDSSYTDYSGGPHSPVLMSRFFTMRGKEILNALLIKDLNDKVFVVEDRFPKTMDWDLFIVAFSQSMRPVHEALAETQRKVVQRESAAIAKGRAYAYMSESDSLIRTSVYLIPVIGVMHLLRDRPDLSMQLAYMLTSEPYTQFVQYSDLVDLVGVTDRWRLLFQHNERLERSLITPVGTSR